MKLDGLDNVHQGFSEALGLIARQNLSTATMLRNNARKGRNQLTKQTTAVMSGLAKHIIEYREKKLAFEKITQKVASLLRENPRVKLLITGHSLGGALSALYTTMLQYMGPTKVANRIAAVYTFG